MIDKEAEITINALLSDNKKFRDLADLWSELCNNKSNENDALREVLQMWVDFWKADGDDVWLAEKAMMATEEVLKKDK